MSIIKIIFFVIFTKIAFAVAFLISTGIYWLMDKFCINFIRTISSLIFGELKANLVINIMTTDIGFRLFCLIVFVILTRWNLKFFGFKTVFDRWTGQKMKTLITEIGQVTENFKEKNKKREKSQQEERGYVRIRFR